MHAYNIHSHNIMYMCIAHMHTQTLFYAHRMREALDMLGGKGITMKESTDGSGRGAAMVAAVAVRLKHDEAAA